MLLEDLLGLVGGGAEGDVGLDAGDGGGAVGGQGRGAGGGGAGGEGEERGEEEVVEGKDFHREVAKDAKERWKREERNRRLRRWAQISEKSFGQDEQD